jgi:ribosomal protein L11 methyltransferase
VAVDVDPDAVEVTLANATANDVTLTAALGSVDALPGPAEVVLANLVTDVVVALADRLVAATRGTLVVSGIATEREPRARAALTAAGAVVEEARHRDGWVALRLRPTAPHDAPGGRPAAPEGPGDDPSTGPGPLGDDTATGRRG